MSVIRVCIALAAAGLLSTACSTNNQDVPSGGGLPEVHVTLSDGRTVVCVKSLGVNGGVGISCDWDHAK